MLWEADLRQPGTFKDGVVARWPEPERVTRAAVKDGQITIFSARTGLYALEWGTGRRLWTRKYDLGDPMPGSTQLEITLNDEGPTSAIAVKKEDLLVLLAELKSNKMYEEAAKKYGFNIKLYDDMMSISMAAKEMIKLSEEYKNGNTN